MGVSISFISATTEELERGKKDPDWASEFVDELYEYDFDDPDFDDDSVPGRPDGGPEKAWAGLEFLFSGTDVRLEFLMDGGCIKEDGTLFWWSVEEIERLARQTRATPWERLAANYDPERMTKEQVYPNTWTFDPEGELEWLQGAYEELAAFFGAAAEGGYGAFMIFSF